MKIALRMFWFKLNELIEDRFPDGLFVALTLLRITADGKSAELFVAGNPDALWIAHDGQTETFPSLGPAIGVLPPMIYAMHDPATVTLSEGALYIFSDGVSDLIIGEGGQTFENDDAMVNHLIALEQNHGDKALDQLMEVVASHEQIDDITISRISFNA